MGQQHRVKVKRRRRKAYVERKKQQARAAAKPAKGAGRQKKASAE